MLSFFSTRLGIDKTSGRQRISLSFIKNAGLLRVKKPHLASKNGFSQLFIVNKNPPFIYIPNAHNEQNYRISAGIVMNPFSASPPRGPSLPEPFSPPGPLSSK